MINALRYEPRGQRFEPRSQQHSEREEQDRHIHLHFHLHLTFRARQGRSTSLNARCVKSMLAALVAARVIPLWLLPWAFFPADGPPFSRMGESAGGLEFRQYGRGPCTRLECRWNPPLSGLASESA